LGAPGRRAVEAFRQLEGPELDLARAAVGARVPDGRAPVQAEGRHRAADPEGADAVLERPAADRLEVALDDATRAGRDRGTRGRRGGGEREYCEEGRGQGRGTCGRDHAGAGSRGGGRSAGREERV